MDEIEAVLGKGPLRTCVVDLELKVRRDFTGLDW